MDSENQEVIYCADDGEYRVSGDNCDKLCIERFYKNHLKSGTHTNNNRRKTTVQVNDFKNSCLIQYVLAL